MPKFLALVLVLVLFGAAPAHAAGQPPSLVDRLLALLGHQNLPKIEIRPNAQPAPAPNPNAPRKNQVEIATTFLPIYNLERGEAQSEEKPQVLPFFASGPLGAPHPNILSLVIMIPDSDREAARSYAFARSVQDDASALHPEWYAGDAFILSPQFLNPEDIAPHAADWPDGGKSLLRWAGAGWIYGGDSVFETPPVNVMAAHGMSSYAVMDFVLLLLARKEIFPDLERVVIAGAGGGGDFVQRYAALGLAPDILNSEGLMMRFVVANAYSYIYLDKTRSLPQEPGAGETPANETVFAQPKHEACPPYDIYPYGLEALPPYGRKQGEMAIRLRYDSRFIFYLAGMQAVRTLKDASPQACALSLQGASLFDRAKTFFAHLQHLYGSDDLARSQRFYPLQNLAEDASQLWHSPCGLSVLYGDGNCEGASGDKLKTLQ